ncbi:MAG: Flp pilus assembly complex ATPase component TadA [Candidatus Riflebacteria bacterium]|nr:Flp pilus assembly complex ATPase component TadA [Candidatus Riflebacteria bacterium]
MEPMVSRISLLFRKLGLLLGSGVPLLEAVDVVLLGLPEGDPVRPPLSRVAGDLRRGAQVSQGLEAFPHLFPPELVAIVRSGESRGALDVAFVKIAQGLEEGTLLPGPSGPEPGPDGLPPFADRPPWPPPPAGRVHVRIRKETRRQGPGATVEETETVSHHHPPPPPPPPPPWHAGPRGEPWPPAPPPGHRECRVTLRLDDEARDRAVEFFRNAVGSRASDVHLEPLPEGGRVRLRVDGCLAEARRLGSAEYDELMASVKILAGMDVAERRLPQQGRTVLPDARPTVTLSVATTPYVNGEAATVRILREPDSLPRLAELGLSPDDLARVTRWLDRPYGLIVVTGPTGSGKTTTLYSLVSHYDASTHKIITVEQPVEFILEGVNQLSLAPELGLTWMSALRAQTRHDPDVLLVGEIPTQEVHEMACRLALIGHVVLTTFHADGVANLLGRLRQLGCGPTGPGSLGLIEDALVGALAQKLVRALCPSCREPVDAASIRTRAAGPLTLPSGTYCKAAGCPECGGSGYRGRIAVFELLELTPAAADAVNRGVDQRALKELLAAAGSRTMLADGLEKASQGLTTVDEVLRVCGV